MTFALRAAGFGPARRLGRAPSCVLLVAAAFGAGVEVALADRAPFGLVLPALRLSKPRPRFVTTDGEVTTIRWRSRLDQEASVLVEASSDRGRTWSRLGRRKASAEMFSWTPSSPGRLAVRLRTSDGTRVSNRIHLLVAPRVVEISFAVKFAIAIHGDGSLRTWGQYPTFMGEPYTILARPRPLEGFGTVRSVAAGGRQALVIREDGRVLQWAGGGQSAEEPPLAVPALVEGVEGALFARAEYGTSFVRLQDGRVFAWGANVSGSLGDGTDVPRATPTEIPGLFGAVDIALGRSCGVALMPDGRVLSWGANGAGQGGDGTFNSSFSPRPVSGIGPAVAVSARIDWAMALLADGTVWTWGANPFGSLGRDAPLRDPLPAPIRDLSRIAQIACGGDEGYAVDDDGALFAWGGNGRGQVGDGSTRPRPHPVRSRVPPVARLFVGDGVVHVIDRNGHRYAWGANLFRQVGNGRYRDVSRPTRLFVR